MAEKEKDEEQTTLDLDKVMEEGQVKFDGELKEAAATPGETPTPDESIPAKKEKEDKEDKETEHPEKRETTDDRGQRAEKEEKPSEKKEETPEKKEEEIPAKKPEVKKEEEPAQQFEDHEKAEDGYRTLQGEKTRVDEDLKKSREKIKELEDAETLKVEREKADKDFNEFAVDKNEEALKAIEELDPDDDEYQKDVAKIWAKKDGDIREFVREHPGASGTEEGAATGTDETTDAQKHVKELAKNADVDPEDEYFKLVCQQAPTKDGEGKPMNFDQQIDWAINKTKNYLGLHKQGFQKGLEEAAEAKTKKEQEAALVLGKGSEEKPTIELEEGKPVSLDDAVESALEERRI